MSPLRWMHVTFCQWTVTLEKVTSDDVTEVGGADGAGKWIRYSTAWLHANPSGNNNYASNSVGDYSYQSTCMLYIAEPCYSSIMALRSVTHLGKHHDICLLYLVPC